MYCRYKLSEMINSRPHITSQTNVDIASMDHINYTIISQIMYNTRQMDHDDDFLGEKTDNNLTKAALHVSGSVRVRVQGSTRVPSVSGLSLIQRDLFQSFEHKQPNVCRASHSQTWSRSQLKTRLKQPDSSHVESAQPQCLCVCVATNANRKLHSSDPLRSKPV